MALEIKSPPVLEGKAAQEFYKRWAESKESKSREEVKQIGRECKDLFSQYHKQLYYG